MRNSDSALQSIDVVSFLALNMSAAAYREQLKTKRAQKRDPRNNSQMAMRDKFEFINQM